MRLAICSISCRKQQLFDNTLIILTSDNGVQLGEHNLGQKEYAYEEFDPRAADHSRPGAPESQYQPAVAPLSTDALALNNDLAPTIAQYTLGDAILGQPARPMADRCSRLFRRMYGAAFRRVRFLVEHKAVTQDYWIGSAE